MAPATTPADSQEKQVFLMVLVSLKVPRMPPLERERSQGHGQGVLEQDAGEIQAEGLVRLPVEVGEGQQTRPLPPEQELLE
jgi:hypothetical protein